MGIMNRESFVGVGAAGARPLLTADQAASVVNYGCALVMAEISLTYATVAAESVAGSLLTAVGAETTTNISIIAEIEQEDYLQSLSEWRIETDEGEHRPPAAVEKGSPGAIAGLSADMNRETLLRKW